MRTIMCFILGHAEQYAEIVRFDNGTTISIHCRRCERLLYCFVRLPAYFYGILSPIPSRMTMVPDLTQANANELKPDTAGAQGE